MQIQALAQSWNSVIGYCRDHKDRMTDLFIYATRGGIVCSGVVFAGGIGAIIIAAEAGASNAVCLKITIGSGVLLGALILHTLATFVLALHCMHLTPTQELV